MISNRDIIKYLNKGHLGTSVVEHLPLAQVVILGPGIESHIGWDCFSLCLCLYLSLCVS